jgi:curved DNA-binding protein CbpA
MDQPANYYSVLGVTKTTLNTDIRQAYNLLVENLRAKAGPDTQAPDAQRLALLDEALHTLLTPDKRKRHDEKLDWHVAKTRLAADRARDAAMRLKLAQDAAQEAAKAALLASKETDLEAKLRASAEARQRDEHARMEAAAAERFRQLREERSQFESSQAAALQAVQEAPTQPMDLTPQSAGASAQASPYRKPVGRKLLLGCAVVLALFFIAYKGL